MIDQTLLEAENERLRQLNEMYRDALAFAGHEWRSQLSLISLFATILEREAGPVLDEHSKQTLERINLCAAALFRIARGYLSLSQVERESFPIRRVFVDLVRDVITPALFSYAEVLEERQQTCFIQEGRPTPLVWADRDMLAVVYDNLIGNAIKHGELGGKIVLSVLERGQVDELGVWNSGSGIAPEWTRTLFDPFAAAADESHEWSIGIGLYLSRKIVEAHGGTMTVESGSGTGVKITFILPKHRGTGGYLEE
jgi:signal transduction histidine kinase